MIPELLDHLWQSTLCAAVAGALAWLLRRHGARVRYWLWFGATLKFLIPFSLLMAAGRIFALRSTAALAPIRSLPLLLNGQPLMIPPGQSVLSPQASTFAWQALAMAAWGLGTLTLGAIWTRRWWHLRRLVRASQPMAIAAAVPVRSSASTLEPGLVGVLRPVLLLPAGLVDHLSEPEIRSIVAHELCHLRRRDNLTYFIHMVCQAVFWFYPLTWWLGRRLLIEREYACDEEVLASGHEPHVYSESIVKVCRYYVRAPADSTAGATGRDSIYARVQNIISGHRPIPLALAKRLLFAAAAVGIAIVPIVLGICGIQSAGAQAAPGSGALTPEIVERRLYEQTRPQKEVAIDPRDFDKFTGYYEIGPLAYLHVYRSGDRFFAQPTGQPPAEQFPESPTKFFTTVVASQLSFVTDSHGRVTEVQLQQNGLVQPAKKVAASVALTAEAALSRRIRSNTPSAGTQAAVRRWIEAEERGSNDYSELSPALAVTVRLQKAQIRAALSKLGSLKTLKFAGISRTGWDMYEAAFANGTAAVEIAPLAGDGRIYGLFLSRLP